VFVFYCNYVNPACIAAIPNKRFSFSFSILSFLRSSRTLNVLLHCLGCLGTFFDSGCLISLFLCLHLFLLLVFAWLLLFFQITLGWADLLSVLWHCWAAGRASSRKKKWLGVGMVVCLERGADLHTAQLMPLPLTVSYFSKLQIGFTFLVPAHLGSPGQRPLSVCVCVNAFSCSINKIFITQFVNCVILLWFMSLFCDLYLLWRWNRELLILQDAGFVSHVAERSVVCRQHLY